MSETLYRCYESELVFIRQLAKEFARTYSGAAGRLLLEDNRSVDPHVERLIEAFALLTGRIQHKLDDEFPELTHAILSVLYPHFLAPVPSTAIVQFVLDASRAKLPEGFRIERLSRLRTTPVNDLPCKFRTGYPVTLWPLVVTDAWLRPPPFPRHVKPVPGTAALLSLRVECLAGMTFAKLGLDRLRFYLSGDQQVIPELYELLFQHTLRVDLRCPDVGGRVETFSLAPEKCLFPVGFETSEGLLPYPPQSFLGYRLLSEFFTFPQKYWFLDLGGFAEAKRAGFGAVVEITFQLDQTLAGAEQAVNKETFLLGCAPAINLFEQTAEPIQLTHARHEYRIVPEVAYPFGMEVYSVDSVSGLDSGNAGIEYQPFFSFRHGQDREGQRAYWHAARRASLAENDLGTDVYLNLVNLDFDPTVPAEETLVVRTTCTNRNAPVLLQRAGPELTFELEGAAPLAGIRCVRSPTVPLRPPQRKGAYWRLLSHLNLNHLSLADEAEGRQALQEILRLYDFSDAAAGQQLGNVTRQIIEGITAVRSRRIVGRTGGPISSGFCRGLEITIDFDRENYVGTGVYLFASVLERFLALYGSVNSFTQLVATTNEGELKKWAPRAGEQPLL
jgi:type VI secretion system protein ImpG